MDLNADVGEVDDARLDATLLEVVTSASVACGFHAGDPLVMRRTVELAAERGVVVGAHPSYADRRGFGRRPLDVAPEQVRAEVAYQVG
ncbi:MAG TPA: LamB/YcsF family protein, partial [Acidimicrobiales bacterium]|nr:LamB/YcsF family protein [Acidimicrobiales bacterium]